jgi:hypothetical protein
MQVSVIVRSLYGRTYIGEVRLVQYLRLKRYSVFVLSFPIGISSNTLQLMPVSQQPLRLKSVYRVAYASPIGENKSEFSVALPLLI